MIHASISTITRAAAGRRKIPFRPIRLRGRVYGKLYQDNLNFLRTILEQAASNSGTRTAVTQKIGDFYAACMDESGGEKRGISPLKAELDSIADLKSAKQMAALIARLQLTYGGSIVFNAGSSLDPDNSEQQIAQLDQGGLGLPDRDYYVKDDAKSKETRDRYLQHVQRIFELAGDNSESAKANADTVMRLETLLAKASLTRVDRRNPYNLKHKMKLAELNQLAPSFDWSAYYREADYPQIEILNVSTPDVLQRSKRSVGFRAYCKLENYLRFHVVNSASPYLSSKFVDENFEFYLSTFAEQKNNSRAGNAAFPIQIGISVRPWARRTWRRCFRQSSRQARSIW